MTKIKEIPINDRPIERLLNKGSEALSNDELLAIILKTGTRDLSAKELASLILKNIKSLNDLNEITYSQLIKIKGIGKMKAALVLAVIEFSKRMNLEVENINELKANTPELIFNYYKEKLKNKKQEYFYAVYLDNRKRIIKDELLFIGTINNSMIHPRDIFKHAYINSATSIILIHNHPTGNIFPSKNDIDTTNKLVEIGKLLGVSILDHIIIGKDKYYSFFENKDI